MFHEIQKDTQAQPFIEKDFQHRERCWGLHNITTINCLGKKEKDYTGYKTVPDLFSLSQF